MVTESGWNHTQAYDSFRYNIMPCLTGNLIDLVFDCQSAIWKEADPEDTPMAFIGQEPMVGFLDIGAWVIPDPVEDDPGLSVEERHAILRERGHALMPGSGSKHENEYVQSVARGNLAVMYDEGGLPVRAAHELEEGDHPFNEIRPDIAIASGIHTVTLLDESGGRSVWYTRNELTADVETRQLPFEADAPYAARITASGDRVYVVAVQDTDDGSASTLLLARSADGGATWEADAPSTLNEGEWARWNPAIAAEGDRLAVVWTDRRDLRSDIYLALSEDGGETFTVNRMNDLHFEESVRERPRNPRNNQALPSVDLRGDAIFISWADFRNYAWDIYGTWSTDAGTTWLPENLRLNPLAELADDVEKERVHGIHQVLLLEGRALLLYEGVDDRGPFRSIHALSICLEACDGETVTVLDFPAGDPAFRPHLSRSGDTVYAVWQDLRNGDNDVFSATLAHDGMEWSEPRAVDAARGQQFNPRLAGSLAIWEDWRSGRGRISLLDLADTGP